MKTLLCDSLKLICLTVAISVPLAWLVLQAIVMFFPPIIP